jgi:hypothetical protein
VISLLPTEEDSFLCFFPFLLWAIRRDLAALVTSVFISSDFRSSIRDQNTRFLPLHLNILWWSSPYYPTDPVLAFIISIRLLLEFAVREAGRIWRICSRDRW